MTDKQARRFPAWLSVTFMMSLYFFFTVLYQSVAQGAVLLFTGGEGLPTEGGRIVDELCMALGVFTSAFILLWLEGGRFEELGLAVRGHAGEGALGALLAAALYAAGFGFCLLVGVVEVTGCRFSPSSALISLGFFALVALTEETLVRGYILSRLLRSGLNKFAALLISSLLFSAIHLFNPDVAWLPLLNLTLAGCAIGASYLYTRNLCFPIGFHWFWNWIQGPILGYNVSGTDGRSSLLTLRLSDNVALSGGDFGFEGSLVCTALLLIATALTVWWGEKREAILLVKSRPR